MFQAYLHPKRTPIPHAGFTGLWREWSRSGALYLEVHYHQGRKEGRYTQWNHRGEILAEGLYREGEPWEGCWLILSESGGVAGRLFFREGKAFHQEPDRYEDPALRAEANLRITERAVIARVREARLSPEPS
jgi:hypothetical protein